MHFIPNEVYHVYNRGNNKQLIFFNDNNYIFFLKKIRQEWMQYCEIISYCLLPNHFHFMLVPKDEGCKNIILGERTTHMQNLSKAIGKTLSSYTKAINIQNQTTGNLFQKKTQAKCLTGTGNNDELKRSCLLSCFHYIHQNPLAAGLLMHLKDWKFSSYPDYYKYRDGTLCNKHIAMKLLSLSENDFKNEEIVSLNEKILTKIF